MAYPSVKPLCYNRNVALTTLIDPAQVKYGNPCAYTKQYPVGGGASQSPYKGHTGIDYATSAGVPILSMFSGKVTVVTTGSSAGKYVTVVNGRVSATYCHMSNQSVKVGQQVKQGDTLGLTGTTGNSTGNHVHITLRIDNKIADPYEYTMGLVPFPFTNTPAPAPAPTPAGNPYSQPAGTLKKGDSGSDVKWLQYELNEEWYGLTVDGSFGAATDAAVRSLQKNKGLTVDGLVGEKTVAALKAFTLGDINEDGVVDTTDARITLQASVGKFSLADDQKASADVNGDSKVDSTDARLILQDAVK